MIYIHYLRKRTIEMHTIKKGKFAIDSVDKNIDTISKKL